MSEGTEARTDEQGAIRETGQNAIQSPGASLAAIRQERGWSVEQVAGQLNLAPRQIAAIESNDFAALPGMAIARGFVRAYAKLLDIDAMPLLAAMPLDSVAAHSSPAFRPVVSVPFSEARLPSMTERQGRASRKKLLLLTLVVFVAAIGLLQQSGKLAAWLAEVNVARGEKEVVNTVPAEPEAQSPNVAQTSLPELAVANNFAEPVVRSAPDAAGPASPVSGSENNTEGGANVTALQDRLVLKLREDSWVEVRRANNSVVLSGLLKAGVTETIEVKEPLSLVIGNASGVDATLRGEPLEIKGKKANGNVARLKLK